MKLVVQRLDERAVMPRRAHPGDAGLDLHALEAVRIAPGARSMVRTGIAIELPSGHAGLVLPRSGLAARHGVALVNAPGLIDEGYRGEVKVLLLNTDPSASFAVEAGARIAQLVVIAVPAVEVVELAELTASARGDGGFGSTGS
jgi:dUTP pyrophosphatase